MISNLAGRNIAVVDDEIDQAAALAALLRLEGIAATDEHVASTALTRFSREPPDAIVIDVKMPGLSGAELLSALRASHPALPAVVLTGFEPDDLRVQRALDSGRVSYLRKPLDLVELLEALSQLLDDA